jgi:hypothetical protein
VLFTKSSVDVGKETSTTRIAERSSVLSVHQAAALNVHRRSGKSDSGKSCGTTESFGKTVFA